VEEFSLSDSISKISRDDLLWVNVGQEELCPFEIHNKTDEYGNPVDLIWNDAGYYSKIIKDNRYVMCLSTYMSNGKATGNYKEMGRSTLLLITAKWANIYGNENLIVDEYLPKEENIDV
jgi:hypothetical protein